MLSELQIEESFTQAHNIFAQHIQTIETNDEEKSL